MRAARRLADAVCRGAEILRSWIWASYRAKRVLRPADPSASIGDRWGFTHGGLMTTELAAPLPDIKVYVRQMFGFDSDMEVPAYAKPDEHVPDIDSDYRFDRPTTLAILAGFARNRRVIVTGYHGTGKSTHIEQVAARLNWPCVRVNLDSHISRIDLIGKDAIVIRD